MNEGIRDEEVIIEEESLSAYELTKDLILYHDTDQGIWWVENSDIGLFDEGGEDVIILIDPSEDINFTEDSIDLWGYELSKLEFEEIKEVLIED